MTHTETLKPAHVPAQHDRRFPNDSDDYRKARLALLAEEMDIFCVRVETISCPSAQISRLPVTLVRHLGATQDGLT